MLPELSLKLIKRTCAARDAAILDVGPASPLRDRLCADGFNDVSSIADVARWTPDRAYDVWHDHEVARSLAPDRTAYARALNRAVAHSGWAILGGIAATELAALLGDRFSLFETHGAFNPAPTSLEQVFRFHIFCRIRP